MFIRTKINPKSKNHVVQIVKSVRLGKKVCQKIIDHVGTAKNEEELKNLKTLAELKLNQLKGSPVELFQNSETISKRVELSIEKYQPQTENSADLKPPESPSIWVNFKNIKEKQRYIIGIQQIYGAIFKGLKMDFIFSNNSKGVHNIKILKNIVLARLALPQSKRQSVSYIEQNFGIKHNLNSVYKMMDLIDEKVIDNINRLSYEVGRTLLKNDIKVIFYDCTTLYFESFEEDELKHNGYSKDGKFNQSQVLLCLIVGNNGLPLGYEVFSGGTFEGHTLEPILTKLKDKYGVENVNFVADAAMLSTENKKLFIEKNQPYIVGARIKNLSQALKEEILDQSTYITLNNNTISDKNDVYKYKEVILNDTTRLIVTYSAKRARKDKADREKNLEKLKAKMKSSKNPETLISNYGYKKFIEVVGKTSYQISEAKIKEAEKWDGLHGINTNIPDKEMPTTQVLSHYKGLWQIEETFRLTKNNLEIRPIFHWTPKRIKAHIAICYLALVMMRCAENVLKINNIKISIEDFRRMLSSIQYSILIDQSNNKKYVMPSPISKEAQKIYKIFGVKWIQDIFELK